jgi:beta-ribofuranosylaminobenzene 5'-phosphate synthase family
MNGIELSSKAGRITSFPRVHITLIGMNNDGYRINGSVGFSISVPKIDVYFEMSNNIEVIDERDITFTEQEKARLQQILAETVTTLNFKKKIRCVVKSNALPHYGLGSNTSIYLSCVEALFILNGVKYSHEDIIKFSKRGGTSGIGINTYFEGGFIFDVGIKNEKQSFIPSSIADRKGKEPLVVHRCKLPNWEIGICIHRNILAKSEQEEIEFFQKYCPINKDSVGRILYESIYGVTSSIIEGDYDVFCASVNAIQYTQWKYLERSLYGNLLIELEKKIKLLGADCVGMSSLGPMLFFTGKDINILVEKIIKDIPGIICYKASFNNQGRIIKHD